MLPCPYSSFAPGESSFAAAVLETRQLILQRLGKSK